MGSTPYPTVILTTALLTTALLAAATALQAPALAQGNPAQGNQDNNPPPATAPASSQAPSPPPDSDNSRFTFHRIDGGFVRLDMRTGELAACTPKGADWNCTPGSDVRAALDREIAKLQRDNAILKNALLEHGVPLPDGMAPNPPASPGRRGGDEPVPRPPQTVPPTASAPAPGASQDDEVDRIMTAVEKGWRRLVEMVTNLRHDLQKKE
jgi:hypothetical protein